MNNKVSRRVLARVVVQKMLEEPERRSHWVRALAAYMVDRHMADDVELVLNDIAHEVFEQTGQLTVGVASARPLSDAVRSDLTAFLQKATQAKQVALTERIDKTLVGGLVARTPDQELDTSVRSQLNQLATIK